MTVTAPVKLSSRRFTSNRRVVCASVKEVDPKTNKEGAAGPMRSMEQVDVVSTSFECTDEVDVDLPSFVHNGSGLEIVAETTFDKLKNGLLNVVPILRDQRFVGLGCLYAMSLLMGSNWVVVKESDSVMDPFIFASLRFGLASLALQPFIQNSWTDDIKTAGELRGNSIYFPLDWISGF
jgi:hypothetical protein